MNTRAVRLLASLLVLSGPATVAPAPVCAQTVAAGEDASSDPGAAAELLSRALTLIRQSRFQPARAMLQGVVDEHPAWGRARFHLALTYHLEQRYESARPHFQKALELEPEYQPQKYYYGWCLYYLGETESARAMFEAFLSARPDYPDAIFALGLIDFDDDAIEEARARFARTIELAGGGKQPATEAKARARLADVHVRTGDLAAARGQLEASLELNPDNYEAWFKLSRVLQRLGDDQGAADARERHREVRERRRPSAPVPSGGSEP